MAEQPVVFISYSHDSDAHRRAVRRLAERLRSRDFDVRFDQFVEEGLDPIWPRWMEDSLDDADFVLLVCTEIYYRRFRGHEEPDEGRGVDWEGAIITMDLYESKSRSQKYIAGFVGPADENWVPRVLRKKTYQFDAEEDFKSLCNRLLAPKADGSGSEKLETDEDESDEEPAKRHEKKKFEHRRLPVTREICGWLQDDPIALKALVEGSSDFLPPTEKDRTVFELVETMWDTPLTKLLELMNSSHRLLMAEKVRLCESLQGLGTAELHQAAMTVEAILERMVPQRVVNEIVWHEDRAHGGLILRVEAVRKPWGEMTVAGYFDRSWVLEPKGRQLVSKADVTPPPALFNFIDSQAGWETLARLAKHLSGLPFKDRPTLRRPGFLQPDDEHYLFAGKNDSEVDWEEVCGYLDTELRLEAEDVGYFHYLVLTSDFVEMRGEFIDLVKNHLKNLHLLILETAPTSRSGKDRRAGEAENVSIILRLLTRSPRRLQLDS